MKKGKDFMGKAEDGILALCVADALGVPAEFQSREQLAVDPVSGMRGYGSHAVPAGSWSDDSSMALCLADSIGETGGVDYDDIMGRFVRWVEDGAYTPHGKLFDIGRICMEAVRRYELGTPALECGGREETDNGNGSLMRILPAAFFLFPKYGAPFSGSPEAMEEIHRLSSLTHAHPRSQIACGIYLNVASELMAGRDLAYALLNGLSGAAGYYEKQPRFREELSHYRRLLDFPSFVCLPEEEIRSGGYVVETLEAAFWCLSLTDSYPECALKAVNLGDDTDTTAAVAGGLAGLWYGRLAIPKEWLEGLAKREEIERICSGIDKL